VNDWHTTLDHLAMLIAAGLLVYLFLAGFTYDRTPTRWAEGGYQEPNWRVLAAMFWPAVWVCWLVYRVTMAYPHYREWKRMRTTEKIAKARVVKS